MELELIAGGPVLSRSLRYAAYRQYTLFIHGRLGKHVRCRIPSCVVASIRRAYPNPAGERTLEADVCYAKVKYVKGYNASAGNSGNYCISRHVRSESISGYFRSVPLNSCFLILSLLSTGMPYHGFSEASEEPTQWPED